MKKIERRIYIYNWKKHFDLLLPRCYLIHFKIFLNSYRLHSLFPWHFFFKNVLNGSISIVCTVVQKKKHLFLQYKLSYRNETGTNHHGVLSTLNWCFKIFLTGASIWGESQPNCNFFNINFSTLSIKNFQKIFNEIVKFNSQIA